ncbi:MAG: helix-turn-helix domain-containing protein [Clostridia bacterium]|nr:helix-turn-helix domain-containing protein [Clostridia bacterium]
MPRGYRHIQKYEEEILRLKEEGKTKREIGKILGFSYEQVHSYITRYNRKQRKIEAGIAIKRKGRPPKDYQVNEADKAAQLRYIIARKDAKIKSLEMENELMRDFLSLTERK